MPVTLSKIASNQASVTLHYGEDSVTVEYYPGRVTERVMAQLQSFSKMDESNLVEGFHAFNETLIHLIKSWDVYEDDAQTTMFPLDVERFADLPIQFRMSVLNAIMEDIRPKNVAEPQSPETSPTPNLSL